MTKHPKGQHQQTQPQQKSAQTKKGRWWLLGQTDPVAGFTGWVCIFTAILVLIGIGQLTAFIQSERAAVVPSALSFDGPLEAGKPLRLVLDFKNGGKAAALVSDGTANVRFVRPPELLPPVPEYLKGTPLAPGPVLSGSTIKVIFDPLGFNSAPRLVLNEVDLAALKAGQFKMYVFGFVSYTDEFSVFRNKETGFCFFYEASAPGGVQFPNCAERAYTYAH